MAEYGVQPGLFGEAIHVGRLNAKGTAFTEKQDRTDMVLAAVAQYVEENFDGGMVADFPGLGLVLEVKVRPISERLKSPAQRPTTNPQQPELHERQEDA
ncbi:MAG: DUF7446 family protein [Mycobacteriaceae bacterium]